ncbi:helix-turn-helix transcriptional regulator [Mesorhizobium sp. WSM3626]|uniref:helix-turn-helix domain-containing protein n=1 Tax=Mesorhizobium sp. WSM3626 TaxID=1040987 RepID=UPI00051875CB|nr:helix-turn-helix transcriptional regulator [Mesorhizobium sp. WSM3626]
MWMKKSKTISDQEFAQEFERGILRSAFVSTFWAVIQARKVETGFTLTQLADRLGINKSAISRWFSGTKPNWEISTIADIANALDVDVEVTVVDRHSNRRFGPAGEIRNPTRAPSTNRICVTSRRVSDGNSPSTDVVVTQIIRSEAA